MLIWNIKYWTEARELTMSEERFRLVSKATNDTYGIDPDQQCRVVE